MARNTPLVLLAGIVLAMAVVAAGTAGTVLVADSAAAQTQAQPDERSIHVAASGQAAAQPDEAVIRVSVESTAPEASTARTQVADNVSAVRSGLASLGLSEDRVRTVGFNIYQDVERPRPDERAEPETRYRARHTLEIRVADIDRVGPVIDATVDNGATNVHDVEYTLSTETRRSLRQAALQDAMDNARIQADTLASSAGLSVGGVHSVSTADVSIPRRAVYATAQAGGDGGTDLDAGPVTVVANVDVTFNASA